MRHKLRRWEPCGALTVMVDTQINRLRVVILTRVTIFVSEMSEVTITMVIMKEAQYVSVPEVYMLLNF